MTRLAQLQSLPLEAKVEIAKTRIREAVYKFGIDGLYISVSGGKDSTVLYHLVRSIYPSILAAFCDTGLEWPEVRDHVKTMEDVTWLYPNMTFKDVIEKYGYPVISKETSQKIYEIRTTHSEKLKHKRMYGDENGSGKLPNCWRHLVAAPFKISHKCCDILKKGPAKKYERETGRIPFLGTMACESRLRGQAYALHGCNSFDSKRPISAPMSVWTDEDVWEYIKTRGLEYAKIYDMGAKRTGCVFCAFGAHMENDDDEGRFEMLKRLHPKMWTYCMDKLGMREVLNYIGVPTGDYKRAKQGKLF